MKWEYKIVNTKKEGMFSMGLALKDSELEGESIDKALNIFGEDSWELVTTGLNNGGTLAFPYFVFKRPKE